MQTFKEFLTELGDTENLGKYIKKFTNRLTLLEPKEIEQTKALLLNLKALLADKLSGSN
jgi:hypothetical protein